MSGNVKQCSNMLSLLGLKYIRAILNTIKYISNPTAMEGNYSNPATSTL